jgi:hypothetical protein
MREHPFHAEVCCFCGLPITTNPSKPRREQGVWHHYDETLRKTNPALYRKTSYTKNGFTVPAHNGCHISHHNKGNKRALGLKCALGYRHTEATKKHLRETSSGRKQSAETIEKRMQKLRGRAMTQEQKDKLSKACIGRRLSDDTKRKISIAGKGRKQTAESIEKTRSKITGLKRTPEQIERNRLAHIGIKLSMETRKKMSEARKGKPFSDLHKERLRIAALERERRKREQKTDM